MKYLLTILIGLWLVTYPARAASGQGGNRLKLVSPTAVSSGQIVQSNIVLTPDPLSVNQGIVGINIVLETNPGMLTITPDDIVPGLPKPWTYVHKLVETRGSKQTITISAIYLQAGSNGYTLQGDQNIATLKFKTRSFGPAEIRIDPSSQILAKDKNADVLSSELTGLTIDVAPTGLAKIFAPLILWLRSIR